jgi:protein-S-isoprenylcysteine O-methyltransferase Ste14
MSESSIVVTIVLWCAFGLQHSIFAQGWVKRFAGRVFGQNFVDYGYRFVYFITQCFAYPAFWYIVSRFEPGRTVWKLPPLLYPVHFGIRVTGHLLIVAALIAADINTFVGTKQLWVYLSAKIKGKPINRVAVFGHNNLVLSFPFTLVRHPMYVGIILSLMTATGVYTEKLVLNLICLLLYVEIGSYFEEKQLVRLFGDAYCKYRTTTPKYLPIAWLSQSVVSAQSRKTSKGSARSAGGALTRRDRRG